MLHLAPCDWRNETEETGVYYCRHSKIHTRNNLVTTAHCRMCRWRTESCEDPRPEVNDLSHAASPTYAQIIWNLSESLAAFAADGFTTVNAAEYAERLRICNGCEQRDGGSCRLCGCLLKLKAQGRAFECPAGKWSKANS